MALKNYTTKVPANRSIAEIQEMLSKHGALGVLTEYEKDTGRIAALSFNIMVNGLNWGFRLPMQWREAQKAMVAQGNKRAAIDEDYCYRVAWRITRDWVDVQMALVELQTVKLEQVFLPYTIRQDGSTLYDYISDNAHKLLAPPNHE